MHQDEVDQFRFQETAHPPNPWPLFLTDLWLKGRNLNWSDEVVVNKNAKTNETCIHPFWPNKLGQ